MATLSETLNNINYSQIKNIANGAQSIDYDSTEDYETLDSLGLSYEPTNYNSLLNGNDVINNDTAKTEFTDENGITHINLTLDNVPTYINNPNTTLNTTLGQATTSNVKMPSFNQNSYWQTLGSMFQKQFQMNQQAMQQDMELKRNTYQQMNQAMAKQNEIAEKQLGIQQGYLTLAQERWNYTKEELDRIKSLRERLTSQYLS